jgi:hypothetical protein
MTLTIELPPDLEAGLATQARAEGLAISEFVQNLIRERMAERNSAPADAPNTEEWLHRFRAWTTSHADISVVLPDEAMERESIYGDRGI